MACEGAGDVEIDASVQQLRDERPSQVVERERRDPSLGRPSYADPSERLPRALRSS